MARIIGRIITPADTRWSYVTVFKPRLWRDKSERIRYSVRLIIPKESPVIQEIKDAIQEVWNLDINNYYVPIEEMKNHPLHDGDIEKPYFNEYKNCYFINAASETKPDIYDENLNLITDPSEVYSGVYGKACIQFESYKIIDRYNSAHFAVGMRATLLALQKLSDGESLANATPKTFIPKTLDDYDRAEREFARMQNRGIYL